MQCSERHKANIIAHKHQQRRTWTGLRVACTDCVAYTTLATICRRRVAACSAVNPATAGPRAYTEPRPSPVQCTARRKAVCNAAQPSATQLYVKCNNDKSKCHRLFTPARKPYLDKLVCCTCWSSSQHNPYRHLQAQDCCNFWSESHHHKLLSTPRNRTTRRPV